MVDDEPHIPVLLERCVELLAPALTRRGSDGTGATLLDATLGAGGHAHRFLTQFTGLRLIGLDRDTDALRIAGERLAPFADRITLVHTRYDGLAGVTEVVAGEGGIDGILFDLGVRSMRLLTNNPAKRVGLDGYGLHIIERVALPVRANAENIRYLMTKRDRMGHDLVGLEDYDEALPGEFGGAV